jgi:predicted DNA-binding WGR domain protein
MKYEHIGWCREGKHDKVWGIIRLHDRDCVTFWGRRGAKLQTKLIKANNWEADDLFRKKVNKGYQELEEYQLNEVYPEFQQDLEKTAFWATFKI